MVAWTMQDSIQPLPYPVGLPDVLATFRFLDCPQAATGAGEFFMPNLTGYKGTEEQRFWRKVRILENGCWEWIGARHSGDYGVFGLAARFNGDRRTMLAHLWVYNYCKGPMPHGLETDHTCRNHWCVNPAHLEAVTHKENMRRGLIARGFQTRDPHKQPLRPRRPKTHCINGHAFTPNNTELAWNGMYMARRCITCRRSRQSARHHPLTAEQRSLRSIRAAQTRAQLPLRRFCKRGHNTWRMRNDGKGRECITCIHLHSISKPKHPLTRQQQREKILRGWITRRTKQRAI